MGQGKGHDLGHGRVIHQDTVDFQWADLFAAPVDDLLEAAREAQIAIVVQCPLIAGAEPAFAIRHKEVLGIGIRVTFVAWGDVVARNHNLAYAIDQVIVQFMGNAHLRPSGDADRSGFLGAWGQGV